ncbi:MAG: hypothetical protein M3N22_04670 [Acidobacteriota bacterium]|nr:hypothetical protein [Acidobacteriota bacterium]
MLTSERLLRLVVEIIFVLLGLLVIWLGLTGHIFFDRHNWTWLILSVALILWGLRGLYKPGKTVQPEDWARGISLMLLGMVLLAISRVPFSWVGQLLACAGLILASRGSFGAALLLRRR